METEWVRCRLTVMFEEPFWVGIFEREEAEGLSAARVVFGAEPSDAQVFDFVLHGFRRLAFSAAISSAEMTAGQLNFKRRQREARRALAEPPRMTKAQEALQLEMEKSKALRVESTRAERDAEAERKYLLLKEKRKERQRGH